MLRAPIIPSLAFLLLSTEGEAISILPVSQSRYIDVAFEYPTSEGTQTFFDTKGTSDLEPFDSQLSIEEVIDLPAPGFPDLYRYSEARQVSSIGESLILAEGFTSSDASGPTGWQVLATSVLDITFEVGASVNYSIEGLLHAETSGISYIEFRDLNEGIGKFVFALVQERDQFPGPPVSFLDSGILEPGAYHLFAYANSCSGELTTGCYDSYGKSSYSFSLTLTPEPSTGILLGLGLGALAVSRGTRRPVTRHIPRSRRSASRAMGRFGRR